MAEVSVTVLITHVAIQLIIITNCHIETDEQKRLVSTWIEKRHWQKPTSELKLNQISLTILLIYV